MALSIDPRSWTAPKILPSLDVDFEPIRMGRRAPAEGKDELVFQVHEVKLRHGRLEVTPPLEVPAVLAAAGPPMLLLNDRLDDNIRAIDRTLHGTGPQQISGTPRSGYTLGLGSMGCLGLGALLSLPVCVAGGIVGSGAALAYGARDVQRYRRELRQLELLRHILLTQVAHRAGELNTAEVRGTLESLVRQRDGLSPACNHAAYELGVEGGFAYAAAGHASPA